MHRCFAVIALAVLFTRIAAAQAPRHVAVDETSLRLVHSKHYDIHTDLDETLLADLSARMDAMYEQYARTYQRFMPRTEAAPLAVYLFESHDRYMAFTDYSGVNTGGLFRAGARPCLAAYLQTQGRDSLRRTLQHEAFHQFAYFVIHPHLPPWLNEGLAQNYEESIYTGGDFIPDQIPPRRLRQMRIDIAQHRAFEITTLFSMTPREWATILHGDVNKASTMYNQSWALVCFCSVAGGPAYAAKFQQLIDKLHTGADGATAAAQVFPDAKALQQDFNAWIARAKPTPEAAVVEQQQTVADFLETVSKHHEPPADMAGLRDLVVGQHLQIQYTRGQISYSTGDKPMQYFSNPDGVAYTADELTLTPDPAAPLPAIICQPQGGRYRYSTRFYPDGAEIEHETVVDTAR